MSGNIRVEVRRIAIAAFFCFLLVISLRRATAAQLQEAEVSQIIKEVQLLPAQAAPRAASLKDAVKNGTAVRTGADSRAELTFTDQTLARMGANTIFSFNEGTRDLNLGSGVMLVHVPKGAGGAKIVTAGVTAGITGTTLMFEYHRHAISKLIVMEGVVDAWLNAYPGRLVKVHAGQMLIIPPNATELAEPVAVDLEKLLLTSLLFTDFQPLPSLSLIEDEIRLQQQEMALQIDKDPTGLDPTSQAFAILSLPPAGGPLFSLITYLGLPAGLWSQPASWTPAIVPNNGGGKTFSAIIPERHHHARHRRRRYHSTAANAGRHVAAE